MLMMPERKKAVTVIVGSLGEGLMGPEMEGDDDASFAKKMCAMKIMKAIKESNVDEFTEYLGEFFSMCGHNGSESEMEDY